MRYSYLQNLKTLETTDWLTEIGDARSTHCHQHLCFSKRDKVDLKQMLQSLLCWTELKQWWIWWSTYWVSTGVLNIVGLNNFCQVKTAGDPNLVSKKLCRIAALGAIVDCQHHLLHLILYLHVWTKTHLVTYFPPVLNVKRCNNFRHFKYLWECLFDLHLLLPSPWLCPSPPKPSLLEHFRNLEKLGLQLWNRFIIIEHRQSIIAGWSMRRI